MGIVTDLNELPPQNPILNVETYPSDPELETDPYPYGWREFEKILPNGATVPARIPLTLEDILHPQVGDFRMHREEHERFCNYLYNVLMSALFDIKNAFVLHDTRVAWNHEFIKPHAPDIAVIFDVQEYKDWSTFNCAEERTQPTLVIEVTSPRTRALDLVTKLEHYEQVGLKYYFIVDIQRRKSGTSYRLLGYELAENGYRGVIANENSWLWMEPVSLWLAIEGSNLVCYDKEGNKVPEYTQAIAEMKAAQQVAAEETRIRIEAEERIRELEAQLNEAKSKK